MKVNEIITEAATDILYHYTSTSNAVRILKNNAFKLSAATGNASEEKYAPKGYPYFLSTSRSKSGDYHRYVGSGGVMFVLNGQWFSQRYPVKPIDYWERSWQYSPDRSRETEDRVFSKQPEIPLSAVTAIHVLLTEQHPSRSPYTREVLLLSRQMGIPSYLYTDEQAWRSQRPEKSVPIDQSTEILKGPRYTGYTSRPIKGVKGYGRSELVDWLELIQKPNTQPLSTGAEKLLRKMKYYNEGPSSLKNELFNARKPDSTGYPLVTKILGFMNKNNLSIPQLADNLKSKWTDKK